MVLTYSQMVPTYLRYHYLRLPTPTCTDLFTALPCPNVVDKWINENRNDCYHNSVLLPGYIFLSDVPCDQALCFLSFSIDMVSLHLAIITLAGAKLNQPD